ncbi:ATPase [Verrucomicrobia bacterium LW23]|nr:ATPase [Verrucomicrobia bacterium LW23]
MPTAVAVRQSPTSAPPKKPGARAPRPAPVGREIPTERLRDVLPPRITPTASGIAIWHATLFSTPASEHSRLFIQRVFETAHVAGMEIDAQQGVARLAFGHATSPAEAVRHLRAALARPVESTGANPDLELSAGLFLQPFEDHPIRISRAGAYLTTWTIEFQGADSVRLSHPVLKRRRDVAYRLEEELTAVQGVRDFSASVYASSITIRLHRRRIDVPRLLRHLEHCWPRLIHGLEGPPPTTRLIASFTLLTGAFVGQYFIPALTPFVLAGMIAYASTNVYTALTQLLRGRIGLPMLYTGTITFTTISGMPFAAAFMATWMQLWPRWTRKLLVSSQRRLFAGHRQRATWARRLDAGGRLAEVVIDHIRPGDIIIVRDGEIIPVDGVVEAGLAAVDEEVLTGRAGALDKAPGDAVYAATQIRTGRIAVRVELIGVETLAGYIGENLPHGPIDRLPTSAEAETIATRMVWPALALSAGNLLLGGPMQPSQSTIRPDYATAPRFSAQLAALHDLSDALRRGIVFRDPAALCRLPATDIYVFDDSPALLRRNVAVGAVIAGRLSVTRVLSYVASAFPAFQNERARALMQESLRRRAPLLAISQRTRHAGSISYVDADGDQIEIATPAFVQARRIRIPASIQARLTTLQQARVWAGGAADADPVLRPLWAIRNGAIVGVVTFERSGEAEAAETIAVLRARNPRATFVHISRHSRTNAQELAARIGIETVYAGLNPTGKADVLRSLGRRTMWIGDGSLPESRTCMEAAGISISVGGAATLPLDGAQVVLLQGGVRGLVPLRRMGRHHRALIKEGYRTVFAANLFCVAGAFFGGFNTLAVAIVSNLGTGYVYARHRSLLNDLIARMEARMGSTSVDTAEEPDPQDAADFADAHVTEASEDYIEHDLDAATTQDQPI